MALISKFVYKLLMNFLSSLQVRPNQNMRCLCKSGVNHGKQLQINYAIPLDFGQIGWRKLQVVAHTIYIFCFWVQTIFYLSFFQFSCFEGIEACVITWIFRLQWIAIVDTVQDFLIKLGIKPCMHLWEINIFSLDNVVVRLTKIMNWADKNWAHYLENKVLKSQSIQKISLVKVDLLVKFSSQKKSSERFRTLKVRIFQSLRRLFIILVGLTMTWFSEKMLISKIGRHGLMPNLIKKSLTVSKTYLPCSVLQPLKVLICQIR